MLQAVERNVVPDVVLRIGDVFVLNLILSFVASNHIQFLLIVLFAGIRYHLDADSDKVMNISPEEQLRREVAFVKELRTMPIAVAQDLANEQHYEVPSAFYQMVLGPNLKYSSGFWPSENCSLEQSEVGRSSIQPSIPLSIYLRHI